MQGPPLSFWLADIAFRAAGNNMFGVYLLSQVCFVVSFWAIFRLGRAIVGAQHAVLAVLLTITITAFAFPSVEFGPHILAQPFWALTLLTGWRIIGEGRRNAWFALSIYAGLLLLTTHAAPLLLAMLGIFALATARGRRMLTIVRPVVRADRRRGAGGALRDVRRAHRGRLAAARCRTVLACRTGSGAGSTSSAVLRWRWPASRCWSSSIRAG